jgi:hypothetical protein
LSQHRQPNGLVGLCGIQKCLECVVPPIGPFYIVVCSCRPSIVERGRRWTTRDEGREGLYGFSSSQHVHWHPERKRQKVVERLGKGIVREEAAPNREKVWRESSGSQRPATSSGDERETTPRQCRLQRAVALSSDRQSTRSVTGKQLQQFMMRIMWNGPGVT